VSKLRWFRDEGLRLEEVADLPKAPKPFRAAVKLPSQALSIS
jgi:hypothetical protein